MGNRFVRTRLTAVVGSLLLLAQLAGSLHLAFTAHHLCLEHGELVHDAEAATSASVARAAPTRDHAALSASTDGSRIGAEQHDHCAVQLLRRSTLWSAVQRLVPAPALVVSRLLAPSGHFVPVHAALFRLAPKHSPPA